MDYQQQVINAHYVKLEADSKALKKWKLISLILFIGGTIQWLCVIL